MERIEAKVPLQERIAAFRRQGRAVALVPTMGALHDGHLALFAAARQAGEAVVASIFVNPLQFGAGEDLDRYPRQMDQDQRQAAAAGVDLLFAPEPSAIYREGERTRVAVEGLSGVLCGVGRPGHFTGVATVVLKLLLLVAPDTLYLGRKDYQQTVVLQRMIRDLDLPVRVQVVPTVRDADGLALSSRNRYLSPAARTKALAIPQALAQARNEYDQGERRPAVLCREARRQLEAAGLRVEYCHIVDPDLLPVPSPMAGGVLAVAAWVDGTRLIDNQILGPREEN